VDLPSPAPITEDVDRARSARRSIASAATALVAVACLVALLAPGTLFAAESPSQTASAAALTLCAQAQPGVHCGPGNGRRTAGGTGTGKVSHAGWPAITGALLIVDDDGRRATGSELNDELLGGHGSDTLVGGAGKDVLWGDQYATNNNSRQHDVLWGGAGQDYLYPSHGTNRIYGGPGADTIRAYYGHGSIDCGSGNDIVQVRMNGAYKLSDCEHVVHFCAWGSDGNGGCRKPGEPKPAALRRTG